MTCTTAQGIPLSDDGRQSSGMEVACRDGTVGSWQLPPSALPACRPPELKFQEKIETHMWFLKVASWKACPWFPTTIPEARSRRHKIVSRYLLQILTDHQTVRLTTCRIIVRITQPRSIDDTFLARLKKSSAPQKMPNSGYSCSGFF